jgi:tetratricopeptide (TPR) repeat protein
MRSIRKILVIFFAGYLAVLSGCASPREVISNPWLVPFQERQTSSVSRSQMRAMARLAYVYKAAGMKDEYVGALITAVELYAGDTTVTFELLNELIDGINQSRAEILQLKNALENTGLNPEDVSAGNMPTGDVQRQVAENYLDVKDQLEARYDECYRILSNACGQIPYNAELYYRTAHLQYLRASEDGDETRYKDAINFLKRAIASDSAHLESYHLIAMCYEKLGDNDRAIRFWRLFEVIYGIAPEVMGEGFITPQREALHQEALQHLESLGAEVEE